MDRKQRVLVVEDEKNIVDILRFNLQKEGYETLEAYDGVTGLRLALEEAPDLILLDLMLPGMNGFEVCKLLRDKGKSTPVLIITAREEEKDKILGLDLGADDYITKPFSIRELMERVWNYEGYVGDVRGVDVAIRRLREKLEDDPGQPKYIITRRGAGYYFQSEL